MMLKSFVLCLSISIFSSFCFAFQVDTRGIDNVRQKAVLSESDFKIIDTFVMQVIREIILIEDFTVSYESRTSSKTLDSFSNDFLEVGLLPTHVFIGFFNRSNIKL